MVANISPDYNNPEAPMRATGWRRSIRGVGGYWQGEFTLYGRVSELAQFFYSNLGFHVQEKVRGYPSWEGMIYEMELTSDGSTRRRSLDTLFNHWRCRYINTDNEIALTAAASDAESIRVYGQRESIWALDGQDQTPAEAVRDSKLAEHVRPWPRTTGTTLGTIGGANLFVRCCGYAFTGNWKYETQGDNTDDDLSTWITEIIGTTYTGGDCEFLKVGYIEENTTQVRKETRIEMRSWDVITKLLELGISDKPARAYVDNDRLFYYKPIDTTPMYFKRDGGFYTGAGSHVDVDPWIVKPAVVRDLSYPVNRTEIGAWLEDARDWYMNEVDVWDNMDGTASLNPKSEEFDESDILTAQDAYKEQLRRIVEREEREKNV